MHSTWIVALTLVIFAGLLMQPVFPSKHNVIRGKKFLCETFAKDLVLNLTCDFRRLNRTYEVWSFEGYYNLTLDNLYIRTTVFAQGTNLEYRPFMISNWTISLCPYDIGTKLQAIVSRDLKKYSNVMHPCPFEGLFYMRNFPLKDGHYPSILPAANVYLELSYFSFIDGKRTDLYALRLYAEVTTKGIVYY